MVSRMRRRRSSTFQKENYRRLTAQGIGAQYHPPVIALADHMVKRSGQFHSWLSRHRSDKTAPIKQNESLTPPPPLHLPHLPDTSPTFPIDDPSPHTPKSGHHPPRSLQ